MEFLAGPAYKTIPTLKQLTLLNEWHLSRYTCSVIARFATLFHPPSVDFHASLSPPLFVSSFIFSPFPTASNFSLGTYSFSLSPFSGYSSSRSSREHEGVVLSFPVAGRKKKAGLNRTVSSVSFFPRFSYDFRFSRGTTPPLRPCFRLLYPLSNHSIFFALPPCSSRAALPLPSSFPLLPFSLINSHLTYLPRSPIYTRYFSPTARFRLFPASSSLFSFGPNVYLRRQTRSSIEINA